MLAASSTAIPHPWMDRANMHCHKALCLYYTQSIPTLGMIELMYTTIALAYTHISSTIAHTAEAKEVKRRTAGNCVATAY